MQRRSPYRRPRPMTYRASSTHVARWCDSLLRRRLTIRTYGTLCDAVWTETTAMECGEIHRRAFLRGLGTLPLSGLIGRGAALAQGTAAVPAISQRPPLLSRELMTSLCLYKTSQ